MARAVRPAAVTVVEGTTNWAWLDAVSSLRKVSVTGAPTLGRRSSHGLGHVNFQTTPEMCLRTWRGCPRSKGHSQNPHKLPFERAAVLGQATRRQCGQGPRPITWGQLGPVGLVSSGAGGDDKVLKPPSNDHSNGERCRQTVAGLTRSQVAWVNRSIQGGYYGH